MNRRQFLRYVPGFALAALGLGALAKPAIDENHARAMLEFTRMPSGWADTEHWYEDEVEPAPEEATALMSRRIAKQLGLTEGDRVLGGRVVIWGEEKPDAS